MSHSVASLLVSEGQAHALRLMAAGKLRQCQRHAACAEDRSVELQLDLPNADMYHGH